MRIVRTVRRMAEDLYSLDIGKDMVEDVNEWIKGHLYGDSKETFTDLTAEQVFEYWHEYYENFGIDNDTEIKLVSRYSDTGYSTYRLGEYVYDIVEDMIYDAWNDTYYDDDSEVDTEIYAD